MTERVCADCGASLTTGKFIQATCDGCGSTSRTTLAEYHTQPSGSAEPAFWRKNGRTYFALTDAGESDGAWIAAESPGEVTR